MAKNDQEKSLFFNSFFLSKMEKIPLPLIMNEFESEYKFHFSDFTHHMN